jgi:hypothetical protein
MLDATALISSLAGQASHPESRSAGTPCNFFAEPAIALSEEYGACL